MFGKIIPAILTNSQRDLKNKLKKIQGLTDWVQIDIMDGQFVQNRSVSLTDLKKIKIPFNLEIHLMVLNPEKYFRTCQKIKAKRVIFHFEAVKNLAEVLRKMKKFNFQRGIALNPKTQPEKIKPYLSQIDSVLFLSVEPGFQAQKFIPQVLKKIKSLREMAPKIKIGLDGGINFANLKKIIKTAPDYLVIGSALFRSPNLKETFQNFKQFLYEKGI